MYLLLLPKRNKPSNKITLNLAKTAFAWRESFFSLSKKAGQVGAETGHLTDELCVQVGRTEVCKDWKEKKAKNV